jgi:hypothetical protein
MTTDLKTSILVEQQVPEFVREEFPQFIKFLKAYYEFLEEKQGVEKNDLVTFAKKLKTAKDVDESLDEFEAGFYSTFAALIPYEVQCDKELLFKQLVNLYKSKGSENSFKLIFHLLFGEDVDVILPKNNVIKPSASKWTVDNKLNINTSVYSYYDADGTQKTFDLTQQVNPDEISVYVNDVILNHGVDYFIQKENLKLIFFNAPSNGSNVKVFYENFDYKLFVNRKVTGLSSGASAIIEDSNLKSISDTFNLGLPIELLINAKSLQRRFFNGEVVSIPLFNSNNVLIETRVTTFSVVRKLNVVSAGQDYKVGDRVTLVSGDPLRNAIGEVETVYEGLIESILIGDGGATFTNAAPLYITGNGSSFYLEGAVDGIDLSGKNAANVWYISTDVIKSFNGTSFAANTIISNATYGFAANANASLDARIIDALLTEAIPMGPITNVKVLLTSAPLTATPEINVEGGYYSTDRTAKTFGSIAKFKINDGGSGYAVGDEIVFDPIPNLELYPQAKFAYGAAAVVGNVSITGGITRVDVANTRIDGNVKVTSVGSTQVQEDYLPASGEVRTRFLSQLKKGDIVDINGESRIVDTITSDQIFSVEPPGFTYLHTKKKLGIYNRYPRGGYGYMPGNFPSLNVTSNSAGSGANIEVYSIASDGETLSGAGFGTAGAILSIKLIDPGAGYQFVPTANIVSTTGTGGLAGAEIEQSFTTGTGRWTSSDSIVSSIERKIQGSDYYVDYSYLLSSRVEFYKYKKILKELLHPVGFARYSDYTKSAVVERDDIVVTRMDHRQDDQFLTISGRVNTGNGSIAVTGVNTKFNIAVSSGILQVGSQIAVNGEQRTINAIISNTRLITSGNVDNISWTGPYNTPTGNGMSNGFIVFSGGGGRLTSLTIENAGSGYSNGILEFLDADEGIRAIANAETWLAGETGVLTVTANAGAKAVNSWITFSGNTIGYVANARVYVNSTGAIINVVVANTGHYSTLSNVPTIGNVYTSLTYYENTATIAGSSYTNAEFSLVVAKTGSLKRVTLTEGGLYSNKPRIIPSFDPHYVYYSNTFTVVNPGQGYSNGTLIILGGDSFRAANAQIEVFPDKVQINAISNNASAIAVNSWIVLDGTYDSTVNSLNARVFVNTTGHVIRVQVYDRGLYSGLPVNIGLGSNIAITSANLRYYENNDVMTTTSNNQVNAIFTLSTTRLRSNGGIRTINVIDSGLYDGNASLIFPNTNQNLVIYQANVRSEVGVLRLAANVAGVSVNGYLRFAGANSNSANAFASVNSAGFVDSVVIYANGVYTDANDPPRVVPDSGVIAVTANSDAVAVNSWITFGGSGSNVANARVYVNTEGYIENVTVIANGAYEIGPSLSNVYTQLRYFDAASSNGSNGNTIAFGTYTNAVFTITTPNVLYQIDYTKNEGQGHSNGIVLFNDYIVDSVSVNTDAVGVNSWINFYTTIDDPRYTTSNIAVANARVYVNDKNYIVNVTMIANGTYFEAPTIGANANVYTGLKYFNSTSSNGSNGFPIGAYSFTNAVFTINTSRLTNRPADVRVEVWPANGSIRRLTIVDPGLYDNTARISGIEANAGAIAVNSWITFSGVSSNAANARIFVNTTGHVVNVTMYANGLYQSKPTIANVYTDLTYFENTASIAGSSYTNAVFSLLTYHIPTTNGPLRAIVNTQPKSISSVAANVGNPTGTIRTYNGVAHTNGFVVFSGGNPIRSANASIEVFPSNGSIRSITINDVGLYRNVSGLSASVASNSIPNSITQVLPLLPDFGGNNYSNGYLKIVGGGANTEANVYIEATPSTDPIPGRIIRTVINRIGLYSNIANVSLYPGVESVSFNAGAVAVNSWIVFTGTPDNLGAATLNVANARVYVNDKNYIVNVVVSSNGIYVNGAASISNVYMNLKYFNASSANGSNGFNIATYSYTNAAFTVTMGPVLHHAANGIRQTPNVFMQYVTPAGVIITGNTGARFTLGYNANTTNLANLVITTSANVGNSANISFTANSNAITNAVITVAGVANSQTIAVINCGFYETNTSAQATFEVWGDYGIGVDSIAFRPHLNVFSISANADAVAVNSWIVFGGANTSQANARVFVNDKNRVENVTIYANGSYSSGPVISRLVHYQNNQPLVSQSYVNAVFVLTAANVPNPRAVNSWINFATNPDIAGRYLGPANGMIQAANARIFVYPNGTVKNVTVYANGSMYGNTITANAANLRYYENNAVFDATTNNDMNVVLTVVASEIGNGVIRRFNITSNGSYYWQPTMQTNTSYIIPPTFIANTGMFRNTTNLAPATIVQTTSGLITEGFDEITTETGDILTTETIQPLG